MKRIRIGKDISLRWEITTDGAAIPLEGRDLMVEIKSPMSVVSNIPFRVDGNTIIMTYYGTEQKSVGEHSVTLWENKGKRGQNVVDSVKAFKLVKTSQEEDDFANGDIQVESADLGTANFSVLTEGGYRAINIDTLHAETLEDAVNINGKTYSGEPFTITLPKANLDQAGIMSAADVKTLQEHGDSISQISAKLDEHTDSLTQVNTTLEEHTNSINATSDIIISHTREISTINNTVSSHTNEISQIKAKQTEQDNSISQINNTLDNHEERLVYTESDLVKVREEYNSIISELVKSIGHTQKAFVVETNDSEGYIYIDNVKKTIPANSIKAFRFNKGFASNVVNNSGIASFRFLVTDTSEITDMWYMFYDCTSLTSLDVSNFDTSKVTNMGNMFRNCNSLTSLDVSNFDTSKVTNMWMMFTGCASLTSLDLSNFDTSAVTNMAQMFSGCASLTSLDLSNFDTSAVTNMDFMFTGCASLTSLDLSNFDTSKVTNMVNMFARCNSLTSNLLGQNFFKTSAVTSIDFSYCSKWTNETVVTSLVTNSYDRAAAGLNTLTLQLHANTKAALTDEQKAAITSKGYTIA